MTEDQIKQIEDEVNGIGEDDVAIEKAWLDEQEKVLKTQIVQVRAAFRLHKFLRNDKSMEDAFNDVKKFKDALEYIRKRRTEI